MIPALLWPLAVVGAWLFVVVFAVAWVFGSWLPRAADWRACLAAVVVLVVDTVHAGHAGPAFLLGLVFAYVAFMWWAVRTAERTGVVECDEP